MLCQLSTLLSIAHATIVILISVRVIMRRPANGVALAWLFLVAVLPFAGAVIYLLVGERRVGLRRARRIAALRSDYAMLARAHDRQGTDQRRVGQAPAGGPRNGSAGHRRWWVFPPWREARAGSTPHRIKYSGQSPRTSTAPARASSWSSTFGTREALPTRFWRRSFAPRSAASRAACWSTRCGARPWWRGPQPERLRAAGVQVRPALPVGLFQMLVSRNDLRLHRKIVVVDGEVAWTGSMNLVDPRYFKQEANVGQWVDAMVRVEGTVVVPLAMTMIGDWMLETAESIETIVESAGLGLVEPKGTADVQVIPSGPGQSDDGLLQMLLAVINSAREELVLTTPYFIPDDSMLRALRGAAGRGVRVDMILPEKVDSLLTRYASRSYYDELMDMGVRIHLYRKGLLHTKSDDGRPPDIHVRNGQPRYAEPLAQLRGSPFRLWSRICRGTARTSAVLHR